MSDIPKSKAFRPQALLSPEAQVIGLKGRIADLERELEIIQDAASRQSIRIAELESERDKLNKRVEAAWDAKDKETERADQVAAERDELKQVIDLSYSMKTKKYIKNLEARLREECGSKFFWENDSALNQRRGLTGEDFMRRKQEYIDAEMAKVLEPEKKFCEHSGVEIKK